MAADKDAEGARAAYAAVKPGSSQYPAARSKLAWTYQVSKDTEAALRLDRGRAMRRRRTTTTRRSPMPTCCGPTTAMPSPWRSWTASSPAPAPIRTGGCCTWRGVALERANRWQDAERDLLAALAGQPNEPELLNYLGYSWIDRGERLGEAMDMVKRAVAANPRSGPMVDSLGWAYYRLGDYRNAVEQLEAAVLLEPADPEINNHLGDAYWRVGRRIEAEFQWKRVLSLDPPEKIRLEAEAKLKSGLGPVGPAASPVTAAN